VTDVIEGQDRAQALRERVPGADLDGALARAHDPADGVAHQHRVVDLVQDHARGAHGVEQALRAFMLGHVDDQRAQARLVAQHRERQEHRRAMTAGRHEADLRADALRPRALEQPGQEPAVRGVEMGPERPIDDPVGRQVQERRQTRVAPQHVPGGIDRGRALIELVDPGARVGDAAEGKDRRCAGGLEHERVDAHATQRPHLALELGYASPQPVQLVESRRDTHFDSRHTAPPGTAAGTRERTVLETESCHDATRRAYWDKYCSR
jgi:hypothetical protein